MPSLSSAGSARLRLQSPGCANMDLRPQASTSCRPQSTGGRTRRLALLRPQLQVVCVQRCGQQLQQGIRCCSSRGDDVSRSSEGSSRDPEDDGESESLVMPSLSGGEDWREFRARLVASSRAPAAPTTSPAGQQTEAADPAASGSGRDAAAAANTGLGARWAHSVPRPEKGCLLCAHPMMFASSQTYFFMSIILILEHNEQGSVGIILNKASDYTMSQLALTHPLPEFDDSRLYVGGDVGGGEITVLHTHPELEGTQEVVRGVYQGGIHAALRAVKEGSVDTGDFRWFAKYSGWRHGQLEAECKRGTWFTAAASPSVILEAPQPGGDGSDRWHDVLELMGGDYARLSRNVKASKEKDKLRRAAQLQQQGEGEGSTEEEEEEEGAGGSGAQAKKTEAQQGQGEGSGADGGQGESGLKGDRSSLWRGGGGEQG